MWKCMLFVFLIALTPLLSSQTLNVAEFDHPPFAYVDPATKQPAGAEIAYLTAILKDAGYQAKFVFVPFPRMLSYLQSGEADVGSLLVKTQQREADITFSTSPVLKMAAVLVVLKDSPLDKLNSKDDIKSMRVGIGSGVTPPDFFGEKPNFDAAAGSNPTNVNLNKLLLGRIDGAVELNPYSVLLELKKLKAMDKIRLIEIPGSATAFYLTISKKSKNVAALLDSIDALQKTKKYKMETFLNDELK